MYICINKQQNNKTTHVMNTTREFQIVYCEGGEIKFDSYSIALKELDELLHQDPTDVLIAFDDKLDSALSLKIGEAMYFQPIRGVQQSKGIILRTK